MKKYMMTQMRYIRLVAFHNHLSHMKAINLYAAKFRDMWVDHYSEQYHFSK